MPVKIFKGTVLLVSSNTHLTQCLQHALVPASYGIRIVRSQEEGLAVMRDINPAILVVDRRESGFSRLHHEIPFHPPFVTVMYHTTPCDEKHCAIDLEDGADRAVCNASPAMIVALLGAVLRRQRWERPVPEHYVADSVTIDLQNHVVSVGSTPVRITSTEFRILKSLLVAPGYFLSRSALVDQVWGEGFAICAHTLDVHISSIRRQFISHGVRPDFILTMKGLGFKLRSTPTPVVDHAIPPYCSTGPGIGHSLPPSMSAPSLDRESSRVRRVPAEAQSRPSRLGLAIESNLSTP